MWQYVVYLWAVPPADVLLACPLPAPGEAPDPYGVFDPSAVAAAYQWAVAASVLVALAAVLACYLLDRESLSRAFVRRWWSWLAGTAVAGALVPLLMLYVVVPQHALAGTCDTNADAFAATFPLALALNRAAAGMVWTGLAFAAFSLLLTRAAGWHPASGGLFHNRGCPWPRVNPFGA
ncbi:MAG TPA: hypothetical protein VF665_16940 [Longimicrobium sp.]|jgi:hypothetical protein|uniref:hypothetical protein n=1 Tax=Longimicrobium sp. TaxID=2029185 RepID=UPI002EDA09F4